MIARTLVGSRLASAVDFSESDADNSSMKSGLPSAVWAMAALSRSQMRRS